ncbi:hypothetical protein JYT58_00920 [bacterium AH-315-G11]|nr:hypothetical protein [bacterium AH-315-G11]
MIDYDNTQVGGLLVIALAFLIPFVYSFFVDNHKKGTPDPRDEHQK